MSHKGGMLTRNSFKAHWRLVKSSRGGISIPTIVASGCRGMCQEKTNDMFDVHKSSSCSLNRSESVTAQLRASAAPLIIRRGACLR